MKSPVFPLCPEELPLIPEIGYRKEVYVAHKLKSRAAFSIAKAVMTLHLVCLELGIPHEVLVTPQVLKIAALDSGERGEALIAGLVPALCGYEDMGLAIKTYAVPMAGYP